MIIKLIQSVVLAIVISTVFIACAYSVLDRVYGSRYFISYECKPINIYGSFVSELLTPEDFIKGDYTKKTMSQISR